MNNQSSPDEQEPNKQDEPEKKFEKSRFFRNLSLGRKWAAFEDKLEVTKQGRLLIVSIYVLALIGLIGIGSWFRYFSDDFFRPADYKLSEEQVSEGYSRTWGTFPNRGQEDIYYRFYEKDEYSLPSCDTKFDWCVFAIPLHKDCYEIAMQFKTSKAIDSTEVVEDLWVTLQSKNGLPFLLGQRVTLGVEATNDDSIYGEIESVWCYSNSADFN